MARDTRKTKTPPKTTAETEAAVQTEAAAEPETQDTAGTTATRGAARARRSPRRARSKATESPEAIEAMATPAPEPEAATTNPLEMGIVVEGRDIRHEDREMTLHPVGFIVTDAGDQDGDPPVIVTTVETLTMEGINPFDSPQDFGDADAIVDMLNGLAEAGAITEPQPQDTGSEVLEALGGDLPIPFWYVMVHQVEDAEQAAAKRRKSGKMAKKLVRQEQKAAGLLHDIFEAATEAPGILSTHERAVARLIALLEVTPPSDKPSQQVFSGILRAERRALAKAIKGKK